MARAATPKSRVRAALRGVVPWWKLERRHPGRYRRAHARQVRARREVDQHVELSRGRVVGDGVRHRNDRHVSDVAEAGEHTAVDRDPEIAHRGDIRSTRLRAPDDDVDRLQASHELARRIARKERCSPGPNQAGLDAERCTTVSVHVDLDLGYQHLRLWPRVRDARHGLQVRCERPSDRSKRIDVISSEALAFCWVT